jgi:hypothetical protein
VVESSWFTWQLNHNYLLRSSKIFGTHVSYSYWLLGTALPGRAMRANISYWLADHRALARQGVEGATVRLAYSSTVSRPSQVGHSYMVCRLHSQLGIPMMKYLLIWLYVYRTLCVFFFFFFFPPYLSYACSVVGRVCPRRRLYGLHHIGQIYESTPDVAAMCCPHEVQLLVLSGVAFLPDKCS